MLKHFMTNKPTLGQTEYLGIVCPIHQKLGLSIWLLVEFDLSCIHINGQPVVWIIGLGIAEKWVVLGHYEAVCHQSMVLLIRLQNN